MFFGFCLTDKAKSAGIGIEGLSAQILLKHINKPELEIRNLFNAIIKKVYEYSNQKQRTIDRINFDVSFYFKK